VMVRGEQVRGDKTRRRACANSGDAAPTVLRAAAALLLINLPSSRYSAAARAKVADAPAMQRDAIPRSLRSMLRLRAASTRSREDAVLRKRMRDTRALRKRIWRQHAGPAAYNAARLICAKMR